MKRAICIFTILVGVAGCATPVKIDSSKHNISSKDEALAILSLLSKENPYALGAQPCTFKEDGIYPWPWHQPESHKPYSEWDIFVKKISGERLTVFLQSGSAFARPWWRCYGFNAYDGDPSGEAVASKAVAALIYLGATYKPNSIGMF